MFWRTTQEEKARKTLDANGYCPIHLTEKASDILSSGRRWTRCKECAEEKSEKAKADVRAAIAVLIDK